MLGGLVGLSVYAAVVAEPVYKANGGEEFDGMMMMMKKKKKHHHKKEKTGGAVEDLSMEEWAELGVAFFYVSLEHNSNSDSDPFFAANESHHFPNASSRFPFLPSSSLHFVPNPASDPLSPSTATFCLSSLGVYTLTEIFILSQRIT